VNVRVLIVDDEQLALGRLSRLLGQLDNVEVVGAASEANEAVAAISRLHPDLVLLDVEMPQLDGFDLVDALARQSAGNVASPPLIAFVTAYPQFALEAFDTGAIDFLCKPVRLMRLEKTIERTRRALAARDATKRLGELRANLTELREATAHVEERHFWVRSRGDLLRITTGNVQWIEAQGAYVYLHLIERSYLVRNTIGSLAEQLAGEGFVRVHKSALVNRSKVQRVKGGAGRSSLVLEGGTEVPIGRKYRDARQDIVDPTPSSSAPNKLHYSGH
jgi:DNA-binding LytR/AlgR family response regulator